MQIAIEFNTTADDFFIYKILQGTYFFTSSAKLLPSSDIKIYMRNRKSYDH